MSEASSTIHDQMGKNGFFWFHGVVEDINDPLKLGRVRVRCFEYHTQDKNDLPTEDLPWATLLMPVTSSSVSGKGTSPSGLLNGSWVIGFFRDGNNFQDPIIIGSFHGVPSTPPIPSLGFNDPEGKWPDKNHLKEPDTNRLARNESLEKTIVDSKKKQRVKNVTPAIQPWLKWDEKETSYAAQYPKNHVIETESGHILELDDTPQKERIGVYHKAGTWLEIHPDGSKVEKTVGEDQEIVLSDKKLLIKGNCYMNMDGLVTTLKTGRDFYIEIGGDLIVHTKGNVIMETDRNFEHRVHGTYTVASDGPMLFVAPRIDFNPMGIAPSLASSPNLGAMVPPTLKAALPADTLKNISSGSVLSTDSLKNISAQAGALQKVASVASSAQSGLSLASVKDALSSGSNLLSTANLPNISGAQNALSSLNQNVGGFISSAQNQIASLQTSVGGALQNLNPGIDLGGLNPVGSGIGLPNISAGLGGIVNSAVGGAMGLVPSVGLPGGLPLSIPPISPTTLLSTATPTSFLTSGVQNITNLTSVSLPPIGGGLVSTVTDTNLIDIGGQAIPTQSLFAVAEGKATLISGYPGRSLIDSAVSEVPAVPIVAFESEFPVLKADITNLDGGAF